MALVLQRVLAKEQFERINETGVSAMSEEESAPESGGRAPDPVVLPPTVDDAGNFGQFDGEYEDDIGRTATEEFDFSYREDDYFSDAEYSSASDDKYEEDKFRTGRYWGIDDDEEEVEEEESFDDDTPNKSFNDN